MINALYLFDRIKKYKVMKKLSFLLLLLSSTLAFSQIISSPSNDSRWTYGGGAGIGVSGGSGGTGTTISISPRIGYRVTDDFEVGVAGGFTWGNSKYYSSTMFGIGPFANYYFGRSFYISGLFQEYFISQKDKYYNQKYSTDEAALYLGAGYMQRIGDRAYMQLGASYNVLYKENSSVFSSGFVPNIGIVFGL